MHIEEYLKNADEIYNNIIKFNIIMQQDEIDEKILEIQSGIKIIQSVAKKMADISNSIKRISNRKRIMLKGKESNKFIDPYPTIETHAILRNSLMKKIDITPELKIPAIIVPNEEYIPTSFIYYIEETKQFAININGFNIKGSLGDIVEYGNEKTFQCKFAHECKNINTCCFYHPPEDFIKLNIPIVYQKRNFTAGSWIYSNKYNIKYNRHIGNGSSLKFDLEKLKKTDYEEELNTRKSQMIHDILIYISLLQYNMLHEKKWNLYNYVKY
jgi:hypothetical protein